MALVLLVGAGLLLKSFAQLREIDPTLTQARLNLTRAQYELVLSDVAMAHATGAVGVAGLPPS